MVRLQPSAPQVDAGLAADRASYEDDRARIAAIWQAMAGVDVRATIRVPDMLPALGSYHRNPDFWGDVAVRELVIETHRQMTLDAARQHIAARVGAERTPTRSALARCWKRLDLLSKGGC
ncbi:hypothetical protein [Sphingomonas sp.]|uniref:hypothetical protein n=1 Tax=Sphingomonas sp. TaxID=28214 RepID=UPI00307F42EB